MLAIFALGLLAQRSLAGIIQANFGDSFVLGDLMENNDALVVGDKKFDLWSYESTGNMPLASDVNVVATIIGGNLGIKFQGGFFDAPGNEQASDSLIEYRVMIIDDPQYDLLYISDAHLRGNLNIFGTSGSTGLIMVDETFFLDDNGQVGAMLEGEDQRMEIYAAISGDEKLVKNEDWVDFREPHRSLFVRKDILAFAGDGVTFPTASFVDQTFSQMPEPTAMTLLGVGALALYSAGRRRRWRGSG